MTVVHVHPDSSELPTPRKGLIPVHLYGSRPDQKGAAAIGWQIYDEVSRVKAPLDPIAFDFLSLALGVTAADTCVSRDEAPDGWAREIRLIVA